MLVSSRATNILLVLLLVVGIGIAAMLATGVRGGPLDPPGPPGSTDGVRKPGTPISSLPFTTTEGGYFYVTRNLSGGAGQSGITICCSNTTIDLGGFTLFGAGAGMNPGDGIANAGARNVVIRNGAVRGWRNGIYLGGSYSLVEGVYATANLTTGIIVGGGSEVRDCNASLNFVGISVTSGAVRNCTIWENSGNGINFLGIGALVEDSEVMYNPYGIYVYADFSTIRNNRFLGASSSDIFGDNLDPPVGSWFMGNVYCNVGGVGLNNGGGNVDRVEAC